MFPYLRNFLNYLGGFEVEENGFIDKNFQFFTIAYFPIFQDGGPKNSKKGTFYITRGFSKLNKTFLFIKIFIF